MLSSPAKRRKTSSTTSVPVDASGASQQPLRRDDGPARSQQRSFKSPTKASLARSRSSIPQRAHTRSPTRSPERHTTQDNEGGERAQTAERSFGLRDRKALRPSLSASWSPGKGPRLSMGPPSPRRASGIQAFTAPPRRVSSRITPADLVPGVSAASEQPMRATRATTSKSRSPPEAVDAARNQEERRTSESRSSEGDNGEPELPPTPTELGLEKAPQRPRGLLSSSPSRLRQKRRISEPVGSSPLKHARRPSQEEREYMTTGLKIDWGETRGEASAKERQKEELSTRLRQLKDEVAELEKWAKRSEHPDAYLEGSNDETRKLISLLTSQISTGIPDSTPDSDTPSLSATLFSLLPFSRKKPKANAPSKVPKNPFALQELADAKPYLTVFAPLTLTTQSTKLSTSVSGTLTETHELTLSAPHPYPQHIYRIPITLRTNPDTQSVTSISVSNKSAHLPPQINRWIQTRLSSPLLKLDISGLCWGLNRYWEATISRAQLWARLQTRYPALIAGGGIGINRFSDPAKSSETDPRLLAPHLERTTMLFSSGRPNEPRLLLSCTLTLDEWTAEPQLHPEITLSTESGSAKVERDAKRLFRSLLGGATTTKQNELGAGVRVNGDSILRAAEGVMSLLFPSDVVKSKRSR
ncbi:hypothetical protein DTO271G3_2909 [Paecilomyces variotii]|nr:hypothetical protein DTO271G3_2909 [Paecilomyces variotii]